MKKIALFFSFQFFALIVLFIPSAIFAQTNQSSEWIRVHSDNGEFSIEVPAKYDYFYDKDGFLASRGQSNYSVKKASLFFAYHENTLLGFESYESKKNALESLYEIDKQHPRAAAASKFKHHNVEIKQLKHKTDEYVWIRQYFSTKNNIYVLTAASRNGESAVMKNFLDSLILDSVKNPTPPANSISFSALKISPIRLADYKKDKDYKPKVLSEDEKSASKFEIFVKPRAFYTDTARMNQISGIITFRVTFNENGFMPAIEIHNPLGGGLARQALFALLRIKAFPEEENGKPIPTTKVLEYSFTIY